MVSTQTSAHWHLAKECRALGCPPLATQHKDGMGSLSPRIHFPPEVLKSMELLDNSSIKMMERCVMINCS